MLEIHIPATFETRTYTPTLSTFDARKFNDRIDVIFVHKNSEQQEKSIHWEPRARVLSVDLPAAEYHDLWKQLWTQRVPTLHLKLEGPSHFDIKPIDRAAQCK